MAFDRLIERIAKLQNPTVAGLDPKLAYIPSYIKEDAFEKYGKNLDGAAAAILEFNKGLIDALCDIVPAVKPQCAYYEMYGWQGVKTLHDTIAYANSKGMFVITDGKRNDIGTTMEAYAAAHFGDHDGRGYTLCSIWRGCPYRKRLSGFRWNQAPTFDLSGGGQGHLCVG